MNATVEQSLISKIRTLSPQQMAEVENFVEFLAAKSRKRAAIDRLLAIAPALEAAGVVPMNEDEIAAEVRAARGTRRKRGSAPRWQQQIEAVAQLPKSQQQFVASMIKTMLAEASAR